MRNLAAAVLTCAAMSLAVSPAIAAPPNHAPGPKDGMPAKAKAYGNYCKDQSRKHVEGEKGTPFSRCVTAMAKVAKNNVNPRRACRDLSRKHVKGEKGTPFSRCVVSARDLKEDLATA